MSNSSYDEAAGRTQAGAAIAIATVEELQKAGVLSADQVRSVYRRAQQHTGGLSSALSVDLFLAELAKKVREDG